MILSRQSRDETLPIVAILLCTFNGARFLNEQLESIARQDYAAWKLFVSDDGSSDQTLQIIEQFATKWGGGRVTVQAGPRIGGATANFLSLACDPSVNATYFAFCDQDDVWHSDKISSAIGTLTEVPDSVPAAYGGRTRLIDEHGTVIGYSPLFRRKPCFRNAIVQSIAGGNTMVFNSAARELLRRAGGVKPVAHDWWLYQLVSGAGGYFIYDPCPHIDYRQHAGNGVGSNVGCAARIKRARMTLSGRFRSWTTQNITALSQAEVLLTPDSKKVLEYVSDCRRGSALKRIASLWKAGAHRQTIYGNLGLLGAVLLNKL